MDTAIADTGASGFYLTPKAICANINPNTTKVVIGTAGGAPHQSSAACDILLSQLPTTAGHIMPKFHHNLLRIGPLCSHGCRVLFQKNGSRGRRAGRCPTSCGGSLA